MFGYHKLNWSFFTVNNIWQNFEARQNYLWKQIRDKNNVCLDTLVDKYPS